LATVWDAHWSQGRPAAEAPGVPPALLRPLKKLCADVGFVNINAPVP
jgi:hypothetical protein